MAAHLTEVLTIWAGIAYCAAVLGITNLSTLKYEKRMLQMACLNL